MTQTYYRVSRYPVEIGEPLVSRGRFKEKTAADMGWVHNLLDATRPEGVPPRLSCLFLFENKEDAKYYLAKLKAPYICEASLGESPIIHRGDLKLVDEISLLPEGDPRARELTRRYWAGESTEKPVWEIMVADARCEGATEYSEAQRTDILYEVGNIPKVADMDEDEFDRHLRESRLND